MKKSGALSVDDIYKFANSISAINSGQGFETEEEKDECKEAIKFMYGFGSKKLQDGMVWNWGCDDAVVDARIREVVPLYDSVSSDGFSEQLYCLAVNAIGISDFSKRRLLDVGCGFGEGLNFASRVFDIRSVVGLDLCQDAIDRANARLSRKGMAFVCGDAEKLPFDDCEMDIIINVESSHTYPDLSRFLKEVSRVLRPGGYFSHLDLFTDERYRHFSELKTGVGLEWLAETDITDSVKRAIQARMLPDSFLRRTLKRRQMGQPVLRLLTEPLELVNFGADFAGHKFNRSQRFSRALINRLLQRAGSVKAVKFNRYLHQLARKV